MTEEKDSDKKSTEGSRGIDAQQDVAQLYGVPGQKGLIKLLTDNLSGIFNGYVLLLTALVAFGGFASYAGHKLTSLVTFYTCLTLILLIPVLSVWYFWAVAAQNADAVKRRMAKSSLAQFMGRRRRAYKAVSFVFQVLGIAQSIYRFPQHPRLALTMIAYFLASAFSLLISGLVAKVRELELLVSLLEVYAQAHGIRHLVEAKITNKTTSGTVQPPEPSN